MEGASDRVSNNYRRPSVPAGARAWRCLGASPMTELATITIGRDAWADRVARAERLAAEAGAAAGLLRFYAPLLARQRSISEAMRSADQPTGNPGADLERLAPVAIPLVELITGIAPETLAADAALALSAGPSGAVTRAASYWGSRSERDFLGKALVQPWAEALVSRGFAWRDQASGDDRRCPACGGAPQLSIRTATSEGDAAARHLQCATCLTVWPFRRVVCAACGEEDERALASCESPDFAHVLVETCDSCHRFLKAIDRTRLGIAVPLVDDVASAAMDAWAQANGYRKVELNLVGI